ncbi:hypothetical protein PTI98_007706 [Pleurotus ostreatus]|nr:hypothetical protein PTI98_007706 [Pleurotus ostreatus]
MAAQDDQHFIKGPKRKRLTKACDHCHKSKRRCDGALPCSNCDHSYFASKTCSYTDASGRPVPAPRPFQQPDRADSSAQGTSRIPPNAPPIPPTYPPDTRYPTFPPHPQPHPPQNRNQANGYPPNVSLSPTTPSSATAATPAPTQGDHIEPPEDEGLALRKRPRADRDGMPIDPPNATLVIERPVQVSLDHGLTRELTNLFFTHCHPAHAIIHKPSFSTALQLNRVPTYLLHAVCALAAPLSKQLRLRTNPMRNAGRPFAQEAMSLMFDGAGRLKADPNLATAQALCLLQLHEMSVFDTSAGLTQWGTRYHDLALQIIDSLGVHAPEHPTLTPVPSPEFIHKAVEHECVRRIFWLIYVIDVMNGLYYKKRGAGWERAIAGAGMPGLGRHLILRVEEGQGTGRFTQTELKLRLPVDETSFELSVHSTLPEYLFLPGIRTQYASELGHLIRVLTIYAKIEHALDLLNDPDAHGDPPAVLQEAEIALDSWANTLPDHLRFSEQSLQVQLSMFETSSNTGAWCYCMTHVLHASAALSLNAARHRSQWAFQRPEVQWAIAHLESITNTLGGRAKNSVLLGAVIWATVKYTKPDENKIRGWAAEHEEFTAVKMHELAQKEWRLVHSPQPRPLPYPPQVPTHQHSQSHIPSQRALPPPAPSSHQHQPSPQHPNHLPVRRLSEVRPPQSMPNNGIPVPRPPPHQHGGDVSYNNRGRSPSNSPSAYPTNHPGAKLLDEVRFFGGRGPGPMQGVERDRERDRERERTNGVVIGGSGSQSVGDSKDSRRMVHDADIDPSLGDGIYPGSRRNEAMGVGSIHGEGGSQAQSLPSLKASGLLDWQQRDMANGSGQPMARSPPSSLLGGEPMDVKPTGPSSAMPPVGLPWLANE